MKFPSGSPTRLLSNWMLAVLVIWACPVMAAGDAALAKVVDAVGGAQLLDSIKTLVVTTDGTRATPIGTIKTKTTSYFAYPVRFRQEISVGNSQMAMVSTPSGAFLLSNDTVAELSAEDRQSVEVTALRNLITLLKSRQGHYFDATVGKPMSLDGRNVETIDIGVREEMTKLVVDPASGRVLRQVYALPASAGSEAGTMTIEYSEFTELAPGLTLPKHARGSLDGKFAFESEIESIKVNVEIAPEMFGPVPIRGAASKEAKPLLRDARSKAGGGSFQSTEEKR